jgi:hypothetical protein
MSFQTSVLVMQDACVATFGLGANAVTAQFTPQDNSGVQQIDGIIETPAMEEDRIPGSPSGASVVRLYVQLAAITPTPKRGDVITINGVHYDIADVAADRIGGGCLKLRVF